MCAAKESRRVWKALNLWRLLQFMKNCSTSRWLILVMLHRNCVCFAFRAAAFGVGDLNIASTTANGINIDFRRLVNIDDDHWDRARLSVTVLVGFGVCALHLRVDKSCVCAPFWLAVGGLAGARRETQVGHRMISPTMYLHGLFMARFTLWRTYSETGEPPQATNSVPKLKGNCGRCGLYTVAAEPSLWGVWSLHTKRSHELFQASDAHDATNIVIDCLLSPYHNSLVWLHAVLFLSISLCNLYRSHWCPTVNQCCSCFCCCYCCFCYTRYHGL